MNSHDLPKYIQLMYITNHPEIARIADRHGVDRIWIDLEVIGKHLRQGNVDSVKSDHSLEDISVVRNAIESALLMVRVNPLYDGSKAEINESIARGADIIMLPMYRSSKDAKQFVDLVKGRAKTSMLLETIDAEQCIEETILTSGADEIHIGLNDLHLAYRLDFMFELLANGTVDRIVSRIKPFGIPYGFGGVGQIGEGLLPAENILSEHYRLGSSRVILSRSFFKSSDAVDIEAAEEAFATGVRNIREYERFLKQAPREFFEKKRVETIRITEEISARIRQNRKNCS